MQIENTSTTTPNLRHGPATRLKEKIVTSTNTHTQITGIKKIPTVRIRWSFTDAAAELDVIGTNELDQ